MNGIEAVRIAEESGVFDEQPIPESLATRCGSMSRSKHACTIDALIESLAAAGTER